MRESVSLSVSAPKCSRMGTHCKPAFGKFSHNPRQLLHGYAHFFRQRTHRFLFASVQDNEAEQMVVGYARQVFRLLRLPYIVLPEGRRRPKNQPYQPFRLFDRHKFLLAFLL